MSPAYCFQNNTDLFLDKNRSDERSRKDKTAGAKLFAKAKR